jgi:aquaporin TIP
MKLEALVAEFIGTFTLIFVGVGAIAAGAAGGVDSGLVGAALAHGLAIAVMVSATAAVSGGHLNPAVTFGALVGGKIKPVAAVGYVIAQCLGGIAAAMLLYRAMPPDLLRQVNLGLPALQDVHLISGGKTSVFHVTPVMGVVMEAVLTFFLVFVVFGTGIDRRGPKVGGLFIGLVIVMDILIGGPITGAAMNPARHLGPAVVSGLYDHTWVYWVGPLLGGGLAGLVYKYVMEADLPKT